MAASPDVLVIGGGIIGLTAALELARAGVNVEVYDKGTLGREASWAGAGIIPPGNLDHAVTPLDKLRAASVAMFPDFVADLESQTGLSAGYRRNGAVEFITESDQEIIKLWQCEQIHHERIERQALLNLIPGIGHVEATAYWLTGMAQIRNPWLLKAIIKQCHLYDVICHEHRAVSDIVIERSRIAGVRFDNGEIRTAKNYLITGGAWSGALLKRLNCELPIRPVRGQIALFRANPRDLKPTLIEAKRYLVPRGDGLILVGSTEEPEAGFDMSTSPEGIDSLKEFAYRLLPSLRTAALEHTWAGLRPGSADGLPSIGRVPGFDNAVAATGHFRSGIQLSLGTARMIRELMLNQPFTIDPHEFRLDRPPSPLRKSAFRS